MQELNRFGTHCGLRLLGYEDQIGPWRGGTRRELISLVVQSMVASNVFRLGDSLEKAATSGSVSTRKPLR
jgi:hypothetical protein